MFSLADCMNDQRIDEVNALVRGFPGGSVVKSPLANAGDVGSIPGSGRSSGEGNDNLLHYLAWEILWTEEAAGLQSMGSQKSQTQLSN